jgi:hypothetical protein
MTLVKNPKDFLAGLLFLAIGLPALVLAVGYGVGETRRMGPGYFPLLLGGGLCCMAAILIWRGLRPGGQGRLELPSLRPLALITASVVVFALALRPLGLFAAVALLVFIGALGSAKANIARSLLLALVLASGSVAIFIYGLRLPIPAVGRAFRDGMAVLGL